MLVPEKYGYGGLSLNRLTTCQLSLHLQLSVCLSFSPLLFVVLLRPPLLFASAFFSDLWVRFVSLGLLPGLTQVVGYRRDGFGG